MRFSDLRMAYKLFCIFLIMVLLLSGIGFVGFFASNKMAESMQVMYENRMRPMHILDTCRTLNKETQVITQTLLLSPVNEAERKSLQAQASERFSAIDNMLPELGGLLTDEIEQKWLTQLWQEMTNYRMERQNAIEVARAGDSATASKLYEEKSLLHMANMDALLQVMSDRSATLAEEQNRAGFRLAGWAAPTILSISFVCIVLALILGWLLNRLITRPLNRMLTVVGEVAAGHYDGLTEYSPVTSRDEIGKLSQGFYKMAHALQNYLQEMENKNQQIFAFAYEDSLTGLPNRRQFIERMEQLIGEDREGFALLFIDLDRFRDINDTLGHSVGDELLTAVAKRLVEALPEADTIARLGGDEFTVIYKAGTGKEDLVEFVQRILHIYQTPVLTSQNTFHITVSIGVSLFPGDGLSVDALLQAADTAMYAAKRQRKNHYQLFSRDMHEVIVRRTTLEQSLRTALEQEEFEIYYQPKVDTQSGAITGMEALLRWHSRELGRVSPAEFIPIAEETGLIIPLGIWVLRRVCKQNKMWQAAGLPPLRVAVNLSPKQFHQQSLVETIAEILEETELEACYLELEITEGALMDDTQQTIRILHSIKQLGIFISIDDFGTGYSSMEYLKRFPIDCLKIDKTFIDEIDCRTGQSAIIRAIILLGSSLSLKIIAEGVETQEQLEFLRSQHCDEIQGFYFYKPLSVNEFEKLFQQTDRQKIECRQQVIG